ncbi:DUF2975 domain-containing protein [Pseudomonas sp.]|uniref:DUF2975 domain-containing protein n=1 Tax=Pseudomonas sp. TaxID=306 RepID=UPI00260EB3C2|nr:DUF2975 domain-containing protein [Pseudomonas sp.]
MQTDRLANHSRLLAHATTALIVGMLAINIAYWVFPHQIATYIGGFSLSTLTQTLNADISQLTWWQTTGGAVISSIPLLILAKGLWALRGLFQAYGKSDYFSPTSAELLGQVGTSVCYWVAATVVLTPVMSVWITVLGPVGQKMLTLSFEPSQLVALFLAASVMIVARSLHNACSMARENQQFV